MTLTAPDEAEAPETLLFNLDHVELAHGAEGSVGSGTLRVTSKRVLWEHSSDPTQNLELEVPSITLHAVSKDLSAFPKPCLYCQITENQDDDDDGEDDDDGTKEVYFVPQDPETLTALFDALSRAAMMNPDPVEPYDGDGDDLIFDASGLQGLSEEQARVLDHLDSMLSVGGAAGGGMLQQDDPAKYEDADADEGRVANGNGHQQPHDDEDMENDPAVGNHVGQGNGAPSPMEE